MQPTPTTQPEVASASTGEIPVLESSNDLVLAWQAIKGRGARWGLGDLAIEVEERDTGYRGPDGLTRVERLARDVGVKMDTMRQYIWIARTFPTRADRASGLSWSHYRITVATEDPMGWIKKALENKWTVMELSAEIAMARDPDRAAQAETCDHCGGPVAITSAFEIKPPRRMAVKLCGK